MLRMDSNHPYQTSFFDKAKLRTGRSTNTNINSDCSTLLWNEHFFRYINVRYMHDQWHRLNIKCLYVHIMNALDDFGFEGRRWFFSGRRDFIQFRQQKVKKFQRETQSAFLHLDLCITDSWLFCRRPPVVSLASISFNMASIWRFSSLPPFKLPPLSNI